MNKAKIILNCLNEKLYIPPLNDWIKYYGEGHSKHIEDVNHEFNYKYIAEDGSMWLIESIYDDSGNYKGYSLVVSNLESVKYPKLIWIDSYGQIHNQKEMKREKLYSGLFKSQYEAATMAKEVAIKL